MAKLEEVKFLLEIGSVRRLTKKIDEVISKMKKNSEDLKTSL